MSVSRRTFLAAAAAVPLAALTTVAKHDEYTRPNVPKTKRNTKSRKNESTKEPIKISVTSRFRTFVFS